MKRKIRKAKKCWPPACFQLPATVEEIERGVTPEVQAERDRYVVLLPCAGRLVPMEVQRAEEPQGQGDAV